MSPCVPLGRCERCGAAREHQDAYRLRGWEYRQELRQRSERFARLILGGLVVIANGVAVWLLLG